MIEASCHCGAVRIEIAERPKTVTECNCSLCRRLGNRMAYYHPDQVKIICQPGATTPYIQGDRTLAMHHCNTCGCTTHWQSIDPAYKDRMAVNSRLMNPAELEGVRVRYFDGADSWTHLEGEKVLGKSSFLEK